MTDIVPKTIAAGVTFSTSAWRAEFTGNAWAMVLLLRGPAAIDLPAERDDSRHVWDVAAADTAEWAPGVYAYTIRATDGDVVREVCSGSVRITPNLAAASAGFDGRSESRKALDAIDAVLGKRATIDQRSYRIRSGDSERELERMSVDELLALRTHFVRVCRDEKGKRGPLFGRQVKVVMGKGG